jgi:hypothetical protein
MSLYKNGKNIIVLREGRISPYIDSFPKPHVNYIEEDPGVYSNFLEEDSDYFLPSSNMKMEYGIFILMVHVQVRVMV